MTIKNSQLYAKARELGFPTAWVANSQRENFTNFINFEEKRREGLRKRSTNRLSAHIKSEFNIPKARAQSMGRNGIIAYINNQQKIAYADQKRERLAEIRAEKRRAAAQRTNRPQVAKPTAEEKRLRRNMLARQRRIEKKLATTKRILIQEFLNTLPEVTETDF